MRYAAMNTQAEIAPSQDIVSSQSEPEFVERKARKR